ncbi:MAG: MotA/TolQ/ExbB proton channel family protein [Actinomyces sp.]|jgi:chemotaxis protein MotA|nr:MotA/TolQ/ExbB proton channel family protein [Actinomyces sp.]MCI1641404.1 MotA/TolQ/ExbB proton channel family protein [Actinomyces sp.]MCI1662306.1 MotA/TolQ/ExbB proton channel family protein [Actinomyces sp.]MCI1691768.1 MotA/TolQ/ExbB proton channel family protein [Actinomyces sp.]MCI1787452.1 MotA/TolQ/ExbB proton channel family protein [Actinomyces sp.]MCI1830915.1 MotA/TolQ/ExbB proton channel family protein [Actinomyces sp.]
MKMDPSGILGTVLALGAVMALMLVEGTGVSAIFLPGPMIIVFAGTIGAGIAGSTFNDVKLAVSNVPRALMGRVPSPEPIIAVLVSLAERARKEGLLALEDAMREIEDPFLRRGLGAAIDGTDAEDLRELLDNEIASARETGRCAAGFFQALGGYAPTIGIIGTVVSLVHVLENLTDVASLGPMIASAFVATLWGVLSANMIWLPLASRMRRLSSIACDQMELTMEGVLALQAGANPRMVGERLHSMLPGGVARAEEQAA